MSSVENAMQDESAEQAEHEQNDQPSTCRCGAIRSEKDGSRCSRGHLLTGNKAAVITGTRSVMFWREAEQALESLVASILSDRGYSPENAPMALRMVALGAAQAVLVRDSAYTRMMENGGPLTGSDRERGAHKIWAAASDRLVRHTQQLGYEPDAAKAKRVQELARMVKADVLGRRER